MLHLTAQGLLGISAARTSLCQPGLLRAVQHRLQPGAARQPVICRVEEQKGQSNDYAQYSEPLTSPHALTGRQEQDTSMRAGISQSAV